MNLLFRRDQTANARGKVQFTLWAKTELDPDEKAIITKYKFDSATLIEAVQPGHLRKSVYVALAASFATLVLIYMTPLGRLPYNWVLALAAGAAAGYLFYDRKRETVLVRDLMHGRYFVCDSVIDLATKEAWLTQVSGVLRQVMEKAKTWGGTESIPIDPDGSINEAKYLSLKGL